MVYYAANIDISTGTVLLFQCLGEALIEEYKDTQKGVI